MDPLASHYEDAGAAAEYRTRFGKSLARRISNALELRMLEHALAGEPACDTVLDVPCGAGRLVPVLSRHARNVVCVDAARAMIDAARVAGNVSPRAHGGREDLSLVRASAFALPFGDAAFDVTVCWRLLQHFEDLHRRMRLIGELGRVTRRTIVLSFSDAGTARARRIRRRRAASGRVAISREQLAQEIVACGLRPVRFLRLFGPLSVVAAVVIRVGRS